jgi:uncharacterized protein YbcV (DUF1398 family)
MESNKYSQTLLKPPEGAKVIETEIANFWMEEDGTVCSVAKKVRRTLENLASYTKSLKHHAAGKKIYYLADLTNAQTYSREEKSFLSAELKDLAKAVAVVSSSPAGKMMSQVLFMKQNLSFPARQFDSVEKARAWLAELRAKEKH